MRCGHRGKYITAGIWRQRGLWSLLGLLQSPASGLHRRSQSPSRGRCALPVLPVAPGRGSELGGPVSVKRLCYSPVVTLFDKTRVRVHSIGWPVCSSVGDLSFNFGIFARSETARGILLRDGVVGFVEETLFRGIILHVLVRAWGRSRRGLLLSVLVQAALFAVPHLLQAMAGSSWYQVFMVVVNGFVSGIWWGVLVLLGGSLWPVMLLHGLSNLSVQVRSLSSASIEPAIAAYGRATLLELPLALLAIWLLLRASLGSEPEAES